MKKYLSGILVAAIACVVGYVWLRPVNDTRVALVTPPTGPALSAKPLPVPSYSSPKTSAASKETGVTVRSVGSGYLDDKTLSLLNLSPAELAKLNSLFESVRGEVCQQIADTGKFSRAGNNMLSVQFKLSEEQSAAIRNSLYANMEGVIGKEKFSQFTREAVLAKFESKFEFFGEFPTRYDFAGNGETLADSSEINIRAAITRTDDGVGSPYISFTEGKLRREGFVDRYHALAGKVLN